MAMADSTKHRVRLRVVEWPENSKDVDELLREHGPDAFQRAIDSARPIHEWAISHLDEWFDLDSSGGKDAAVVDLVETLAAVPALERAQYVRLLAEKLGVPEADVRTALREAYVDRHGRPPANGRVYGVDIPELE